MLDVILKNFVCHVQEKMVDVLRDVKTTYHFEQVEAAVADLVDEVATALVQACLKDVLEAPEFLTMLKQRGMSQGLKFHGYRSLSVAVYTGRRVTVWSPYFVQSQKPRRRKKAGPHGRGQHLGLMVLGFLRRGSARLVSWVVKLAVLMPSYEIAQEVLAEHGLAVAVTTMRHWCRALGGFGVARRGAVSLTGQEALAGATLVIEMDGGRLRLRRKKRGPKPSRQKRQGYHTPWKEPKLFTMYLADAQGRIQQDFLPIHDATLGDDEAVFALMAQYLNQWDLTVLARVVVCGDGARWIWRRIDTLLAHRGVPPQKVFQVVDYTHAKQNLQEIVTLAPPHRQKRLMKVWKRWLFNGEIARLGEAIRSALQGPARDAAVKKWEDYFLRNTQRMQYRHFQAAHLPCGSGHVESAIRRVINLRLKAPGTFWMPDMAEYFLFLRSQLLSGRWNIFMTNVRKCFATSGCERPGEHCATL